jgi:hypothetical protein
MQSIIMRKQGKRKLNTYRKQNKICRNTTQMSKNIRTNIDHKTTSGHKLPSIPEKVNLITRGYTTTKTSRIEVEKTMKQKKYVLAIQEYICTYISIYVYTSILPRVTQPHTRALPHYLLGYYHKTIM